MTFISEFNLDLMEKYLHAKNEVNRSSHSKVIIRKYRHIDRHTDTHRHRHTQTDGQTRVKPLPPSLTRSVKINYIIRNASKNPLGKELKSFRILNY